MASSARPASRSMTTCSRVTSSPTSWGTCLNDMDAIVSSAPSTSPLNEESAASTASTRNRRTGCAAILGSARMRSASRRSRSWSPRPWATTDAQRQRHRLCGLVTSILEVGFELVELGIEFVVISTLCVAQRYLEELVLRGAGGPRRCAGQPASSGVDRQRAEALEHEGDASHAEHVGVLPAYGGRSHANGLTSLAKGLEGTPTHVGDLRRREDPLDGVLPQLVGPEPALCVLVQQGNRSHQPVDVDLRAGDGCHFAVRSRAEHGEGEQS